jgi:hypothetical protein
MFAASRRGPLAGSVVAGLFRIKPNYHLLHKTPLVLVVLEARLLLETTSPQKPGQTTPSAITIALQVTSSYVTAPARCLGNPYSQSGAESERRNQGLRVLGPYAAAVGVEAAPLAKTLCNDTATCVLGGGILNAG